MDIALRRIIQIRGTAARWLWFYSLLLLAWLAVAGFHGGQSELRGLKDAYGADVWIALCAQGVIGANPLLVLGFWAVMATAMMAPTVIPTLRTLDDLIEGGHAPQNAFAQFIAGYLLIWTFTAVLGASVQILLARAGVLDPLGESLTTAFTAGLLGLAGLYQFTRLKAACLSQCRAPLTFFMQYWGESPWRMGLRMGLNCVGCCWALMLLAFAGGMSSMAMMGLATALMILEKLPDIGRYLTRPLGAALLSGAVWVML